MSIEKVTIQTEGILQKIADYETGFLYEKSEVVKLFSHLLMAGMIDELNISYRRKANALIRDGYLKEDGTILKGVTQ